MGQCMMPVSSGGAKVAIGTVQATDSKNLSVQDLDFKPTKIAIWIENYSDSRDGALSEYYCAFWTTGYKDVVSYAKIYGITVNVNYLNNGFTVTMNPGYSGGYFRRNVNYKYAAWAEE